MHGWLDGWMDGWMDGQTDVTKPIGTVLQVLPKKHHAIMWSIGGKWLNNFFFLISCFLWVPRELNCQLSLLWIRLIKLFWIQVCSSHTVGDSIYPRGSEITLMNQNNNCFYFSRKLHTLIYLTCFITCFSDCILTHLTRWNVL